LIGFCAFGIKPTTGLSCALAVARKDWQTTKNKDHAWMERGIVNSPFGDNKCKRRRSVREEIHNHQTHELHEKSFIAERKTTVITSVH
jgi:hypothetical protein